MAKPITTVDTNGLRSWRRKRSMLSLVTAVAAVTLLVGTASAAPASGLHASVTYSPPYSGTPGAAITGGSVGCGGSGSILLFPSFNLTTGKGVQSAKASAKSCGSIGSSVDLTLSTGFNSSNFTTTSGLHRIVAHWTLTFSVSLAAKAGSASQGADAVFYVGEGVSVYDATNHTLIAGAPTKVVTDLISSGTYSHTYSKVRMTSWNNATLVKGHVYTLQIGLEIVVAASVSSGSSTASAQLSMGGGSKGFLITSVTMS
jgi:hypothetical protein